MNETTRHPVLAKLRLLMIVTCVGASLLCVAAGVAAYTGSLPETWLGGDPGVSPLASRVGVTGAGLVQADVITPIPFFGNLNSRHLRYNDIALDLNCVSRRLTDGSFACASYHLGLLVPFRLLAALLAAYPAVVFLNGPVTRFVRRARGRCVACGGTLPRPSATCPTCGTAPVAGRPRQVTT